MMTEEGEIVAVLDWEFAGSYPLSEAISSTFVDIVEVTSEEFGDENVVWGLNIQHLIGEGAR